MMANRYKVENDESLSWVAANALDGPGEGHPGQDSGRQRQDGPRGVDDPEDRHHGQVDGADDGQAGGDPRQVPEEHVVDAERPGQLGEIGADPLDGPHDGIGRVVRSDLHAGAGEQSRCQERDVRHAVHAM